MKRLILLIAFTIPLALASQVNWSENIAPILYEHCAKCHHPGGIGPSSLITYDDAFNNSGSILAAITEGFMPPWPADPGYRHFANENVLSTEEKNLIEQWVMGGAIEGNSANAPMPLLVTITIPQYQKLTLQPTRH